MDERCVQQFAYDPAPRNPIPRYDLLKHLPNIIDVCYGKKTKGSN